MSYMGLLFNTLSCGDLVRVGETCKAAHTNYTPKLTQVLLLRSAFGTEIATLKASPVWFGPPNLGSQVKGSRIPHRSRFQPSASRPSTDTKIPVYVSWFQAPRP